MSNLLILLIQSLLFDVYDTPHNALKTQMPPNLKISLTVRFQVT